MGTCSLSLFISLHLSLSLSLSHSLSLTQSWLSKWCHLEGSSSPALGTSQAVTSREVDWKMTGKSPIGVVGEYKATVKGFLQTHFQVRVDLSSAKIKEMHSALFSLVSRTNVSAGQLGVRWLKRTSWCPPSQTQTCCQQHHCNNDNNNNNNNNGNIASGTTTMCPSQEGSCPLPGTQTCCHLCLGAPMVINHPIEEEVQEMLNTDCQQMSTSALWSFGLPAMTVRRCQHDAALG